MLLSHPTNCGRQIFISVSYSEPKFQLTTLFPLINALIGGIWPAWIGGAVRQLHHNSAAHKVLGHFRLPPSNATNYLGAIPYLQPGLVEMSVWAGSGSLGCFLLPLNTTCGVEKALITPRLNLPRNYSGSMVPMLILIPSNLTSQNSAAVGQKSLLKAPFWPRQYVKDVNPSLKGTSSNFNTLSWNRKRVWHAKEPKRPFFL